MENKLNEADQAFKSGDLSKGIMIVEQILDNDHSNIEALLLKAQIRFKQQEWGNALNALNKVLMIEPDQKVAIHYRQMIMNILSFWNKDNYNP